MPPRRFSRYTFSSAILDENERLFLTDREPFQYQPFSDNRQHLVQEGDTLFSLAARYFSPLPRPAGLWWVIADFQQEPIHDPTLLLPSASIIVVPSLRTVNELIFSEQRREASS